MAFTARSAPMRAGNSAEIFQAPSNTTWMIKSAKWNQFLVTFKKPVSSTYSQLTYLTRKRAIPKKNQIPLACRTA